MSSSHSKVGALLGGLKTHIPALGQFVQRHSHQLRRAGTFSAAFVSIALGGFLCVAPFGEFASGEDLHWTSLVSLVWLVMALTMVAAGFAVLLRMHVFRRLYQVSFLC